MIKKACFVLLVVMCPASLFAGETMVTRTTTTTTTRCNFRVDKCETAVSNDPGYFHYKDYTQAPATAGPSDSIIVYKTASEFVDYPDPQPTVDLLALIRSKLSNCPEVAVSYNPDSGDITVHYPSATCDCDCDWVVNVRNVKAEDFVWQRTPDNYSNYLGQMERQKFHCRSEKGAQDIEAACVLECKLNGWPMYK